MCLFAFHTDWSRISSHAFLMRHFPILHFQPTAIFFEFSCRAFSVAFQLRRFVRALTDFNFSCKPLNIDRNRLNHTARRYAVT